MLATSGLTTSDYRIILLETTAPVVLDITAPTLLLSDHIILGRVLHNLQCEGVMA